METMEQSVWQRVLGAQPEQPDTDLKTLALETVEAANVYSQLLRSSSGKERDLLKRLLDGTKEDLACLKGLHRLQTAATMKLLVFPPKQTVTARELIKQYHRTRRAQVEYMARSAESDWGCVFRAMAQRQENHCVMLAQLIGHMGN